MSTIIDLAQKRAEKEFRTQTSELRQLKIFQKTRYDCIDYYLRTESEDEYLGNIAYAPDSPLAVLTAYGHFRVIEGTENIRDALQEKVCDVADQWPEPVLIKGTECLSLYTCLQEGTRTIYDVLEQVPSKLFAFADSLLEEQDFIQDYCGNHN